MTFIYISIPVLAVAALFAATSIRRIIVVDGREALLYRGGRYVRVLTAGTHWVYGWKIGKVELDVREANLTRENLRNPPLPRTLSIWPWGRRSWKSPVQTLRK